MSACASAHLKSEWVRASERVLVCVCVCVCVCVRVCVCKCIFYELVCERVRVLLSMCGVCGLSERGSVSSSPSSLKVSAFMCMRVRA